MKSKLSVQQFYDRLNANVHEGSAWIKGSPFAGFTLFDSKVKFFYGEHSNSHFELTRNSGTFNMTEFVIKGYYKSTSEHYETQVNYEVRPIPLAYYLIRLAIPLFLTFSSFIVLFNFSFELLIALIFMWIVSGLAYLIILWRSRKLRNKLELTFKEYFKIAD